MWTHSEISQISKKSTTRLGRRQTFCVVDDNMSSDAIPQGRHGAEPSKFHTDLLAAAARINCKWFAFENEVCDPPSVCATNKIHCRRTFHLSTTSPRRRWHGPSANACKSNPRLILLHSFIALNYISNRPCRTSTWRICKFSGAVPLAHSSDYTTSRCPGSILIGCSRQVFAAAPK